MDSLKLIQVIEAPLPELLELRFEFVAADASFAELTDIQLYLLTMIAFFQGDRSRLEEVASACMDREIHALCRARTQLLSRNFRDDLDLTSLSSVKPEWRGEALFILASIRYERGHYAAAAETYATAQSVLDEQGALKKSLNCRASCIAALSWLDPKRTFFSQYLELYREARRQRNDLVAACSLLNLSREHQKVGGLGEASRSAVRALAILRDHGGSFLHDLVLSHYCQLLAQSDRVPQARLAFQYCLSSRFPEIQSALHLMAIQFPFFADVSLISPEKPIDRTLFTPTWRERADEGRSVRLSRLEEQLVAYLGARPRSRDELRRFLYGDRLSRSAGDERLKSLLERVRRKLPRMISYDENLKIYRIDSENGHTSDRRAG